MSANAPPCRALVTGGTAGIGAAIVRHLRADGADVVFSGRDARRGAEVAAATGATFVRHDARDEAMPLVAAAVAQLGGLDALVLNAGVIALHPLLETPADELRRQLEVNVDAPVRTALAALDVLAEGRAPAIVATASNAGLWGETAIGAYSVTKAALIAAVRVLAVAAGARGIRVNAVCPGDTEPGMAGSDTAPDGTPMDPFATLPPLGRLGTADDTAHAVLFLLAPAAGFTTGTTLLVDGGMHATLDGWRPL